MGGLAQNVQKPPPGKNVQKSQGQIFQECVECQECQGQIPRSNPKVKCQGQMGNRKKPEKTGKMGKCNKNKKTINTKRDIDIVLI